MSSYKKVSVSISSAKAKKLAAGKVVNLTFSELSGDDDVLHLHPANYEKVMKAKAAKRGCRLQLAEGEIAYDIAAGGNIFKSLWKGLKTLWQPVIKPALSLAADNLVPIASAYTGNPAIVAGVRKGLKDLTGVGMPKRGGLVKGSPEAKQYMAAIRARKRGGSFKL